jgi:hypothetical protein
VYVVWGRVSAAAVVLVLGVTTWWLLIVGAVVLTVPTPEAVGTASAVAPGHSVHISVPSSALWLIPIDRVTYYDVDRALLEDDEDALIKARAPAGWVVVRQGQVACVVDVDRDAVQIELLESPNAGGRGWLKTDYLRSYASNPGLYVPGCWNASEVVGP